MDAPAPPPPSRFANFFSKRSFKGNPLKRTKSVTKLERKQRLENDSIEPNRLRTSRSHESLLQSSPSLLGSVDLSAGDVQVSALHTSLLNQPNCFQLCSAQGTRYYHCRSAPERDNWLHNIRWAIEPNKETMRRVDKSLNIWILEAKGMASKKRYFCEVCLDKTLYARTSSKQKADLCFWGEKFEFNNLSQLDSITINMYREADKKKRRDKNILLGTIVIPVSTIHSNQLTERWYKLDVEKGSGIKTIISIRIKSRFQTVDILPLETYADFIQYLKTNYINLSELVEPVVNVRAKEDIATALVHVMQKHNLAGKFLADMVIADVNKSDDHSLTFRGNTLATKATESYMKLLGEKYLQDTLLDVITRVLEASDDCEVDPTKVSSSNTLQRNQVNLMSYVEMTWIKIIKSAPSFPIELKQAFSEIRQRLSSTGKEELANNIISASIFLRFLCPAILSPSLFNLTQEYPQGVASRNLTLIAKTIQTLANFTRFGGKENFMEFMNEFVEREWSTMKSFLKQISSHPAKDYHNHLEFDGFIDLGKELSLLHGLLIECLPRMSSKGGLDLERLQHILDGISAAMSLPTLIRQTSTPTPPVSGHPKYPMVSSLSLSENKRHEVPICSRPSTLPRSACLVTLEPRPQEPRAMRQLRPSSHSVDNISGFANRPYSRGAITPDYIHLTKELDSSPDSQVSTPTWESSMSTPILPPPLAFNNPMYHFPPTDAHSPCSSLSSQSSEEISIIDSLNRSGETYHRKHSYKSVAPRTNPRYSQPVFTKHHFPPDPGSSEASPTTPTNAPELTLSQPHSNVEEVTRYDEQVDELRQLMRKLQNQLAEAEMKLSQQESNTEKVVADWKARLEAGEERLKKQQEEKDQQMKNIISRLITVEEELRKEQQEMQGLITAKQKVIDAQERKIQSLDSANTHLLSMLSQLKERYHNQNGIARSPPLKIPLIENSVDSTAYRTSSC